MSATKSLPRIEAYMWWCGDEWCNCTQPRVERVTAHERYPWIVHREVLWRGTFHSGASRDEAEEQQRELAEARIRYGAHPQETE